MSERTCTSVPGSYSRTRKFSLTSPLPSLHTSNFGIYLAFSYNTTDISPKNSIDLHSSSRFDYTEISSLTHLMSHCLPVAALKGTWSWRDIFTSLPLLRPVEVLYKIYPAHQADKKPNAPEMRSDCSTKNRSNLKWRLYSQLLPLICSTDGHGIRLGKASNSSVYSSSFILGIHRITYISHQLTTRIDHIWEERK